MAQPAPFTLRKAIVGVLMIGWLVLLLWALERRYDESDFRKVDELFTSRSAPWSLEKELLERNPGNAPSCEKELISSFRGLVRVTCTASGMEPWQFEVDLVRRRIRGTDPRSEEVVATAERRRRPPDTGEPPGDAGEPQSDSGTP